MAETAQLEWSRLLNSEVLCVCFNALPHFFTPTLKACRVCLKYITFIPSALLVSLYSGCVELDEAGLVSGNLWSGRCECWKLALKNKNSVLFLYKYFKSTSSFTKTPQKVGFLHPSSFQGSKLVVIKEMITAVGLNSAGEEGTQDWILPSLSQLSESTHQQNHGKIRGVQGKVE